MRTKRTTVIISIVILTAGLAFGGWYLWGSWRASTTEHSAEEHPQPQPQVSEAPVEGQAVPGYAEVQLDPERLQRMGVTTEMVSSREFSRTVRTVGIVEIDETRVAHVQTKFEGWIEDLYVDYIGKPVKKGQPLFSVYSPDLVTGEEEYLLSLRSAERDARGPIADDMQRWSKSLLAASRRRLERWNVPAAEIERLERERTTRRTIVIDSPREGIVLAKTATKGMNVEPGMDLFTIADLSRVWVQAEVYERDIAGIRVGQKAALTLEAMPGEPLYANVVFVSPTLSETTRTAKVRLEFDNRKGLLKPGMYATVELTVRMGSGLAVPEEAIIDTGERKIVFVALGEGRFVPRDLVLGPKFDRFYTVLSGLAEGDSVATSAQFLLDSESRIKAAGGGAMAGHGGMGKDEK
jgi:Cu(I)/Ag(I) efflux system membrane fusion protein